MSRFDNIVSETTETIDEKPITNDLLSRIKKMIDDFETSKEFLKKLLPEMNKCLQHIGQTIRITLQDNFVITMGYSTISFYTNSTLSYDDFITKDYCKSYILCVIVNFGKILAEFEKYFNPISKALSDFRENTIPNILP